MGYACKYAYIMFGALSIAVRRCCSQIKNTYSTLQAEINTTTTIKPFVMVVAVCCKRRVTVNENTLFSVISVKLNCTNKTQITHLKMSKNIHIPR